MGTDKRERQKAGRQTKILEETAAAKKQRTVRTVRNVVIAAVVILGGAFAYSTLTGDDDDNDTATEDSSDTTTDPLETTPTTVPVEADADTAAAVEARGKPDPAPPAADTPADALDITTLVEGTGEGVKAGDQVMVEYVGKTPDGNIFDFSWENHDPIAVTVGTGGVIPGWDQGLLGAKLGERRRLVIGSENAYGNQANGDIPANSPLAFEVDIVGILPAG